MKVIKEHFDPSRTVIGDAGAVLAYLNGGAFVRCMLGRFPDAFDPSQVFRSAGEGTDGLFVWSMAVAYYVDRYQVAPPAELLAHIRAQNYHVPAVSDEQMTAATEALRHPRK
jgi:hypothetical protein